MKISRATLVLFLSAFAIITIYVLIYSRVVGGVAANALSYPLFLFAVLPVYSLFASKKYTAEGVIVFGVSLLWLLFLAAIVGSFVLLKK